MFLLTTKLKPAPEKGQAFLFEYVLKNCKCLNYLEELLFGNVK